MKYTVLGAGMMGSAAAYDIARSNPGDEVVLADINLQQAKQSASAIGPNVTPIKVDVHQPAEIKSVMKGSAAVISAVSYSVNYQISKAAIHTGVHLCDLGGNNDVVQEQLSLDSRARETGIAIIPNCGLAPGLINILAIHGSQEFSEIESISLRVGGLPQHPRPPLDYQISFSVEGLLNEYIEKATVIRDGKVKEVDSMSDVEEIIFPDPFGRMEAFNTSGGLSTLTQFLNGKVGTLDYKTIRYKGHCEKFRALMDLGFTSSEPIMVGGGVKTNREFFADLLRKKLDTGGKDVVLARATLQGRSDNAEKTLAYEFIDYYDDDAKMTAMMRTTAFPTSIIAQMLAKGTITMRGVLPPEACVPGDVLIYELRKRNVNITKKVTQVWR